MTKLLESFFSPSINIHYNEAQNNKLYRVNQNKILPVSYYIGDKYEVKFGKFSIQ